ncbi:MAG: DNA polymerase III subunit delta [Candidatus Eisenbacteria bacterium]|nr:DNA polymerase III subunit delta [Candidatus Eisenbacteria bacterium]
MTFRDFQELIAAGEAPPVVLMHGEEPYLARVGVDLLRKAVLAPGSEAFDFASLAGRETTAETIVSQATTAPMLSKKRLTVVYDVERMSPAERKRLLDYVKKPVESSCVALVSFERLSGKGKFERALLDSAAVVDCGRLSRDVLLSVARKMAEERGLAIEEEALLLVADWTEGELQKVANELGKLACYARESGSVGVPDVEAVVGARASSLRDLALAVAEGKPGEALALFEELVDEGANAAQLVTQLYGVWTMLWSIRAAGGGRGRGATGSYLLSGVPDLAGLSRARTSRDYARGVGAFYRADTEIRRGLDAETTAGLLVYELASRGRMAGEGGGGP